MKYRIRFNKSRGKPNRGTLEHVWRVFEGEKEYLVKHFKVEVPTYSEKEANSDDWNLCCDGVLHLNRDTSTATISNQ